MNQTNILVGIIGGSGLGNLSVLKNVKQKQVTTKYGKPSSPLRFGTIKEVPVVFIARHGIAHTIPPTHINNRANIIALKKAGCTHIIAVTAVGSLREKIGRGDIIFPDQFIDHTKSRILSFHDTFQPHHPVHVSMAEPFSKELRSVLIRSAKALKIKYHAKGTVITIEGSRFSTRAESFMYRAWGADIINMSTVPEITLANELDIPYATIAMSTDYDCWKKEEEPVTHDAVLKIFSQNIEKVVKLLITSLPHIV